MNEDSSLLSRLTMLAGEPSYTSRIDAEDPLPDVAHFGPDSDTTNPMRTLRLRELESSIRQGESDTQNAFWRGFYNTAGATASNIIGLNSNRGFNPLELMASGPIIVGKAAAKAPAAARTLSQLGKDPKLAGRTVSKIWGDITTKLTGRVRSLASVGKLAEAQAEVVQAKKMLERIKEVPVTMGKGGGKPVVLSADAVADAEAAIVKARKALGKGQKEFAKAGPAREAAARVSKETAEAASKKAAESAAASEAAGAMTAAEEAALAKAAGKGVRAEKQRSVVRKAADAVRSKGGKAIGLALNAYLWGDILGLNSRLKKLVSGDDTDSKDGREGSTPPRSAQNSQSIEQQAERAQRDSQYSRVGEAYQSSLALQETDAWLAQRFDPNQYAKAASRSLLSMIQERAAASPLALTEALPDEGE